jgi:hypothetical protein
MQVVWRVVRLGVVAAWLILVGILVRDHFAAPAPAPGPPAATASSLPVPDESWMGVYMHDRKIGYSHERVVATEDGYRFAEDSLLRLTVMDAEQTVRAHIDATTGRDYALQSFSLSLQSGLGALKATGTVDAGKVNLSLQTAGDETRQQLDIDGPIYLPATARALFASTGLKAGEARTLQVFDPSAMRHSPMEVRVQGRDKVVVGGRSVPAWRMRESFRGAESTVWMDDAGQVLREEGPMGLVTLAESPEIAVSGGWAEGDAFDLMAEIAVPVRRRISRPRELAELTVRLRGVEGFPVPQDARQSYRDGVLRIRREEAAAGETYALPYRGREWRDELAPTPFMQIDHPRVRAAAREALGGETDARRAARRIREWVFGKLAKKATASIPNALQVLEMGAGDCNEHAVLWAALARACGLPARVVAGAVYANGVFLYHAWDEAWLGSSWVSVDPAFDQMPADATHIKLIEGGPEMHANLITIIGRLGIEVLSASDAAVGAEAGAPQKGARR